MNGLNSVMVSWPSPLLLFKLAKLVLIKNFKKSLFYSAQLKLNKAVKHIKHIQKVLELTTTVFIEMSYRQLSASIVNAIYKQLYQIIS